MTTNSLQSRHAPRRTNQVDAADTVPTVMPCVVIRAAATGDVTRCQEIDRSTEAQFAEAGHPEFVDGGSIPDDAARRGIEEHRMFVAEIDGLVVRWVSLGRDDGELCIGQISVDRTIGNVGSGQHSCAR